MMGSGLSSLARNPESAYQGAVLIAYVDAEASSHVLYDLPNLIPLVIPIDDFAFPTLFCSLDEPQRVCAKVLGR